MESKQNFVVTVGGHLVGFIKSLSYKEMEVVFGKPNSIGDKYKTCAEWNVKDTKQNPIYIYDYKETNLYDSDLPSIEEFKESNKPIDWHIGSSNPSIDYEGLSVFISQKLKKNVEVISDDEEFERQLDHPDIPQEFRDRHSRKSKTVLPKQQK